MRCLRALLLSLLVMPSPVYADLVPAQFIAKQYTEALGRIPDPGGWSSAVSYFGSAGCNQSSLEAWGIQVWTSAEFKGLGYGNAQEILLLYRAILNREPDQGGYTTYYNALQSGSTISYVADIFYKSGEFQTLVPYICNGGSYAFGAPNAMGPQSGLAIAPAGASLMGQGSLQAMLCPGPPNPPADPTGCQTKPADPGTVVSLPEGTVVQLGSTLEIPDGVLLETVGQPNPDQHGFMARLVRASAFCGDLIKMDGGATLTNVWVDGERDAVPWTSTTLCGSRGPGVNIHIYGGDYTHSYRYPTSVAENFVANTDGAQSILFWGNHEGYPCSNAQIVNNLVTVYPSEHQFVSGGQTFSDGISVSCEAANVTGNSIVDATDVAIVISRSCQGQVGPPLTSLAGVIQKSQVIGNEILNAGNSGEEGISVDPLYATHGSPSDYCSDTNSPNFTGSLVQNNQIWTGPNAHYIIRLGDGSSAFFRSTAV